MHIIQLAQTGQRLTLQAYATLGIDVLQEQDGTGLTTLHKGLSLIEA